MAVSSCGEPEVVHSVSALRPDKTNPERFVCELAGTRPPISPDYLMNWQVVGAASSVADALAKAQAEHRKYVEQSHAREMTVVNYVLVVEEKLFLCHNNMTWQREFYQGLDAAPGG